MIPLTWNGSPVSAHGLYSGITLEEYHSANICNGLSVSSSGLRRIINESPAHYWDASVYNPDREEQDEKEAFILGRAVHHLLLGEPNFKSIFELRPEKAPDGRQWHANNHSCQKWIARQKELGKTILKPDQLDNIVGMAKSIGKHPLIRAGILNGLVEHSLFFKDRETDIWLKTRPDCIPNDSGDVADLKTTHSVQWPDLERTIADFGYVQQGALIEESFQKVLGIEMTSFSLVFIEKKRPYCVQVVTLKRHDLDLGHRQNRAALKTFANCMKTGYWPGPGGDQNDARFIEIPDWARNRFEDRIKYGVQ